MTMTKGRISWLLALAALAFVTSFTLFAQGPPASGAGAQPQGAPPAPVQTGPPEQGQAQRGQAPGAGRQNNAGADFSPKPPVVAKSPADEAKSFVLPPGYRMELVASEPDVISPSIIEFDGNGRMYVAEFISYMPDADGNRQHDPINRITRWESTKGDGRYDKRTVFADKLILPRMILPLQDGVILTNETDSDDVIKLTDTNGDGVADKKELFYSGVGVGRDGNLEHEQSGFVWGLDNWIYSTYNAFRFRWTPHGILREPTGANNGQWGLAQDDDGKMWWVDAGGERGPVNFQVPIHYMGYRLQDEFEVDFDKVWPLAGVGDMQGGMGRVRMPIGVLNHLTAACGPDVFRGDKLPADLRGDLLFAEPVGRLIRRAKIVKNEGLTFLKNAYPGSEFILSTDLLFRPVNMRTAPDGTVYIADMYHGIIQESNWTRPSSYLRRKIEQYQLDKQIDRGRIWRLRYDGMPAVPEIPAGPASTGSPGVPAVPAIQPNFTAPRMYSETPAQLVAHFSHPNGWWRDTAQRLLILKQDKSVVPALQQIVQSSEPPSRPQGASAGPAEARAEAGNLLARFHALWTLEGLGVLDAALVRQAMSDPNPRLRVQAIRASETLYKAGNRSLESNYRALTKDTDPDVAIQAMLTLNLFKIADLAEVVKTAHSANTGRGVQEIGNRLLNPPVSALTAGRGGAVLSPEQQDQLQRGNAIFTELCFTCHGNDGRGQPMPDAAPGTTLGPPLAGSPRVQGHRDYVIKTLLHGLSGPIEGKSYPAELMIPLGTNNDEWIAAAASFVRNAFGNTGSFVRAADVARVRAATSSRKTPWTVDELLASLPVLLQPQPTWRATASHNTTNALNGLSLAGWSSGVPQQAEMWFQVELPSPAMLAEVQFDSLTAARAGGPGAATGRGGAPQGARGAVPAGAPGAQAGPPPPTFTFPRAYRVQLSMDGAKWNTVAEAPGSAGVMIASFQSAQARFVRITQTATVDSAPVWSILNLRLYTAGK